MPYCRLLPLSCVEMCSGTLRKRFQPSQKRCRNFAGAAQIKARLVTSMLVGVRPMDPVSLGLASSLLLLTALAAALAPGWRATHVDPIVALRAE